MFTSALKSFTSNITANYTVSSTPTTSAGVWRVYDAKNKKTGKAVSVFTFERKSLEHQGGDLRSRSNGASRRKIHEEVIERLKKEASSLARLRHPNVLQLIEPVEDTRNGGLTFATEPITATLAGLLQDKDDQDSTGASRGGSSRYRVEGEDGHQKEVELDELEIQKGLLQVAKGLEFLHESAGLVHGNLTPDAIYINQKSDWKISGLGFSGPSDSSSTTANSPPIAISEVLYHDPRLPRAVQLNLDYSSPDFVVDSNISSAADMFSLGLVLLALYNSPHESPLHTNTNLSIYKKLFSSQSTVPSPSNNFLCRKPLPNAIKTEVLPRLITRRPAERMNAREFQQSGFFDNILVSTLRFLDSFPAKNANEKSQFMRGLPRILEQFPKSILDKKVLPALLEETKDRELLALIFSNVFKIITILPSPQRAFTDRVLPRLREVFGSAGNKASASDRDTAKEAGLVVVLENIRLIAEHCSGKEFKDDVLPIIQIGLESPTHSLVDKSLGCLSIILAVLDFPTIKNELFPVVVAVFSKTSSLAIKVRGLEAFNFLCGGSNGSNTASDGMDRASRLPKSPKVSSAILDKYTVQEKVVPLLKAIKTKEPAVMMAALAVFSQIGSIVDTDFFAMECLPILWGFSLGPLLNLQQFSEFMTLIKKMSSKIEQEQMKKLKELSTNSTNGFDIARSTDLVNMGSSIDLFGESNGEESDFERLVLGKSSGPMENGSTRPQPPRVRSMQGSSPTLSWPNSPQGSSMNSVLHPQPAGSSEAITPDQSLNSFAPLKPSPTGSNFSTWNTVQPTQFLQASQTTNSGANPWAISQANTKFPNAWTDPPAPNSNTFAWSNPPTPQNPVASSTLNNGFGHSTISQNAFSMPPPPSMANQSRPKTGLDKYESLI